MANKIGMLLSLLLFAQAMLFCGDLIGYQLEIIKITNGSIHLVRKIEEEKGLTPSIQKIAKDDLDATISCADLDCNVSENGMLKVKISSTYNPLLLWMWNVGVPNVVVFRSVYVK